MVERKTCKWLFLKTSNSSNAICLQERNIKKRETFNFLSYFQKEKEKYYFVSCVELKRNSGVREEARWKSKTKAKKKTIIKTDGKKYIYLQEKNTYLQEGVQ